MVPHRDFNTECERPRAGSGAFLGCGRRLFRGRTGEARDARRAHGMGSAGRSDLPADHAAGRGGYGRAPGYGLLVRFFFLGVS